MEETYVRFFEGYAKALPARFWPVTGFWFSLSIGLEETNRNKRKEWKDVFNEGLMEMLTPEVGEEGSW